MVILPATPQFSPAVTLGNHYNTAIHRIHKWLPRGMVWIRAHENEVGKAMVMFTCRAIRPGELLRCTETHVIFRLLIYFSEKVQQIHRQFQVFGWQCFQQHPRCQRIAACRFVQRKDIATKRPERRFLTSNFPLKKDWKSCGFMLFEEMREKISRFQILLKFARGTSNLTI